MDLWFLGHIRVKYQYQSSPLFLSVVCRKTQDEKFLQSMKIKRVVCSEEERRLALGKLNLLVNGTRNPSNYVLVCAKAQPCTQEHREHSWDEGSSAPRSLCASVPL